MTTDLIINFTPTGMIPTKDMTPHVPISVNEIVEEVHEAWELGITLTHLHARDGAGKPTCDKEIYRRILDGVRKHCPDLVVCLSLSGRDFSEFEKRSAAIELQPDMGSLTLSSLNFARQASINAPDMIGMLVDKMSSYGVRPELEIFDLGMINYAKYLIGKARIEPPFYFNIILGNVAGMQVNATSIGAALSQLPEGSKWALGGIGIHQLTSNSIAIALGGGVRVGIEDNIFYDKQHTQLATNNSLLRRIHILMELHERKLMTPKTFGSMGFYNTKYRVETSI
jgi:3-oxoadipate:acetyl-CoA acetyltransferase